MYKQTELLRVGPLLRRLMPLAMLVSLFGCAGGPVGWGGTDEVLFADNETIKIQWDNLTTSEGAVRQKAIQHCARTARSIQLIDASSDTWTLGMIRSRTWKCIPREGVAASNQLPREVGQRAVAATTVDPNAASNSQVMLSSPTQSIAGAVAPTSATPIDLRQKREVGKDVLEAEKLAKTNACHTHPVARMAAKGAGFENYTILCSNSDTMIVRCEFGNCRVLR